jgi:hypothetical protein
MNKITITKDIAQELAFAKPNSTYEDYTVIEQDKWESDGKYEYHNTIFQYQDKFYRLIISRTGSYYSEYIYDWEYQAEFE